MSLGGLGSCLMLSIRHIIVAFEKKYWELDIHFVGVYQIVIVTDFLNTCFQVFVRC
jgi:hypothetical protein